MRKTNIEIDGIISCLKTINWTESWLITLVCFHIIIFSISIFSKSEGKIRITTFIICICLVYSAENINELAAQHWRHFSEEQYFDSKGLFISVIFSAPLLLNCILIVAIWLYNASQMLLLVGRAKANCTKKI